MSDYYYSLFEPTPEQQRTNQLENKCLAGYRDEHEDHAKEIRAVAFRTKMIGGGNSYSVYIPIEEIETYKPERHITIVRGENFKKKYWEFYDALLPESFYHLPLGWDRYQTYCNNEKECRKNIMPILKKIFPELQDIDSLPLLWIPYLNYESKEVEFYFNPEEVI